VTISATGYTKIISDLVQRIGSGQLDEVARAADLLTAAVNAGGVIHAFGCGHSEAVAKEIAGRAGGLVPTSRIELRDVVLYGGEPVSTLANPELELDPGIARRLYELAPVRPEDAFVLASNSGVNGAIVEMALLVKERGHPLIAITSREHSGRVESRHASGRKLGDLADVVLDNGAPYGDAAMPLPGGGAVGAVSSITAALLAQQVVIEVVARLLAAGGDPPVYESVNIPGGRARNAEREAHYAGRLRRLS
jgi:uncharacterized phosphosugar-binding protein